ncbi:MAG: A/G-specific adenine glycosylase [Xanthomonadaceae bacterium]|nr:A/G-specific adenine glycosylase [Xanthomonadaceae bacterium]
MDGFARRLLHWYDRNGRHDLPWQEMSINRPTNRRSPYRVWVSEVMLQQTQVATVIPYFERFVQALPDVAALAVAPEDQVMALWSGLGYYRRARHLHAAARLCVALHGGELPRDFDALAALPGLGRSTAAAILAQAHGHRHAILDGNVKRVLARFHGVHGWPGERNIEHALWSHAETHTPSTRIADYTQAIMDLGATVCTRANPRCAECPQSRECVAHRDNLTHAIPAPRPARALPEKHIVFVVLRDEHGRVLLQRRPPQGVWPRLWSLPEANDTEAAGTLAAQLAKLDHAVAATLPGIRHAFTHFRLRAAPLEWRGVRANARLAEDPDSRWCSPGEIATLGIPAPVLKLLHSMSRTVYCQKAQRETEGLDRPPCPGELGQRVYEHIGREAWQQWLAYQTMLINENRLSPRDPATRAMLGAEMQRFLFGDDAAT